MAPLLEMKDIVIEGMTGETWEPIIKGLDLKLDKGEVLGLIGESGAGKSTLGLAAMGYTRQGCRIASGSIRFDGQELYDAPESLMRTIRGARIAYVAQSAAASFNPAHKLIDQYCEAPVVHGVMGRDEAEHDAIDLTDAIDRRVSVRDYAPDPLSLGELSYLLWATQGVRKVVMGGRVSFRTVPSALTPLTTGTLPYTRWAAWITAWLISSLTLIL